MIKNNKHLLLFCQLIILSCNQSFNQNSVILIDEQQSKHTVLKGLGLKKLTNTTFPQTIGLIDTILLVIDRNREDRSLHFYTLDRMNYLGSYGQKGHGSLELLNPFYHNQYWYENDSLYFIITDAKSNILYKLNATNILLNKESAPDWSYRLPSDLIMRFNSIYLTKDSSLIGNYRGPGIERGRFFIHDIATKTMKWIDYFPVTEEKVSSNYIPYYYYSFCSYNVEKQLMISAMNLFKRIDIINNDGLLKHSILFKNYANYKPTLTNQQSQLADSSLLFFNDSFSGHKYFYAVAINKNSNNYLRNNGNMELYVFDWDGALVKKLNLDRIFLGRFFVDETNQKLYIVNFCEDREDYPIIEYDLRTSKIF